MKNWKLVLFAGAAVAASYAFAAEAPAPAAPQAPAQVAVQTSVDTKFGKVEVSKEVVGKVTNWKTALAAVSAGSNIKDVIETLVAIKSKNLSSEQKAALNAFLAALKPAQLDDAVGKPIALTGSFAEGAAPNFALTIGSDKLTFEPKIEAAPDGSVVVAGDVVAGDKKTPVNVTVSAEGNVAGTVAGAAVSGSAPVAAAPAPSADVTAPEIPSIDSMAADTPDNSALLDDKELASLKR